MSRRVLIGIGILVVGLIAIGGPLYISVTDSTKPEQAVPPLDAASDAAAAFLDRYVEPDGRVVRRDQGNDVVSEGQAYAMLASVAIGDRARFDSTWNWAKANLQQPNGLMAWKWQDGKIADPQPATDADMDAARALAVAAKRFNDQRYDTEAKALAKAITDHELAYTSDGKPVVLAGPWATTLPYYTNPSYHSPRAEQELLALTGDQRWQSVSTEERARTAELLKPNGGEIRLPSDWATVDLTGKATAASPPGNSGTPPLYSYDAVRLPIRLAESCDPTDRQQSAQIWSILNKTLESRSSAKMSLEGSPQDSNKAAVAAVAAAAGAHAAGDTNTSLMLLDEAQRIESTANTYYGTAWIALGRIMLTTPWLGTCANSK